MEWYAKVRKYESELKGKHLPLKEVTEHPLKPFKVIVSDAKMVKRASNETPNDDKKMKTNTSWGGIDPLSVAMNLQSESNDIPIERRPKPSKSGTIDDEKSAFIGDDFDHWNSKKSSILNKYTTSEKLSIKTSFLSGGNTFVTTNAGMRNLQNTSVAEKVKHRLEQLDDFEEGSVKEMLNLTQHEYVNHIEELNAALHQSWDADQRVKALKIAIQCSKLLADVSVIQFYPSKFVLITDILDNFGTLVYKRIHCKAGSSTALDSAKETCKNWFFKIASVRELIPRFYVETAILKTYGFLIEESDVQSEYIKALKRLTKMIRGIGDPLVSMYAKAYLSRVSIQIVPECKAIFQENFTDFMHSISQLSNSMVRSTLASQRIDIATYYSLYIPALDWLIQCIAYKAPNTLRNEMLSEFKRIVPSNSVSAGCSALILNSLITCISSNFVSEKASEFLELVKSVSKSLAVRDNSDTELSSNFPTHLIIRNLGMAMNESHTYWTEVEVQEKLKMLNEVWKIISKFKSTAEYISCAEIWIEFVVRQFGFNEINTILGDIIKHMLPDRAFELHYNQLVSLISKVVSHRHGGDFATLFSMTNFMPFLDLLQKESVKVEACKVIVESFAKHFNENLEDNEENITTSDPVILNSLTYLCKTMHDSVSALTLEDEKRQISSLIVSFLKRVSFRRDFEAQLNFYVESRGNFSNLDVVLSFLVHRVNTLAMETRRIVKGYHTKKTTSFVRACLAYSFITIPSLEDVIMRLQLYLFSSHVSLINGCLPQTDAFLKASITLIPQVPKFIESTDGKQKSTEPFLTSYISEMISFLLVVPDHPEQEPLYLLRGLLNVIRDYPFETLSDGKAMIYMNILNFLSAAAQENYPYHINRVDSNDTLYGNDGNFMNEISSISVELIEEILNYLKKLGDERHYKKQALLSFEFFYRVIIHGDLKKMSNLAIKLWQLTHKNGAFDSKHSIGAINFLKNKAEDNGDIILMELITKIEHFKS